MHLFLFHFGLILSHKLKGYTPMTIQRRFLSCLYWAALVCCVALCPASGNAQETTTAQAATPVSSYLDLYKGIQGLFIDEGYTASNIVLKREAALFTFQEGMVYLTQPVFGKVRALVFIGTGTVDYEPPTEVEQEQLRRFFEKPALSLALKGVVMFVGDTTLAELQMEMKKAPPMQAQQHHKAAEDLFYTAKGYLYEETGQWLFPALANSFLEDKQDGMFHAHIFSDEEDLFFTIDPSQEEEVSLRRLARGTRVGTFNYDLINQFHTEEEYARRANGANTDEDKSLIAVEKYTVDCSLSTSMDMAVTAELQFTGNRDGYFWIPFALFYDLDVTSAQWGDGTPAAFFKGEDNGTLWIHTEKPIKKGEKYTLKLAYNGGIMNRYGDWLVLWSSMGWYPMHGYLQRSLFDVTFHYPQRYILVGVGENTEQSEKDEIKTSRWVTKTPIRNCSFNIGKFKQTDFTDDTRIVPMSVLMNDVSRTGSEMDKQVGEDVINSLVFFQELYGKLPIERFYATEIPLGHGEAFPGLIHLSSGTFERTGKSGNEEMFRAHEVAHQWWGIGLDFKTYHDQWLSEAFAEYSSLMYMQLIRKDNDLVFGKLEQWRDRIIDNRKTIFGAGVEAGPIWLGYRTATSSTEGDYGLIIYNKGAWVLHMLRNILIDIKTLKEDRFLAMMKEFYTTYAGKRASTEDFHAVVEKHVGMDMDWFFKQWVYGTAVPKYTYAYKTEKTPEGKYKVTMRVKQEHVPEGFQMPIPLHIDFGEGRFIRWRIMVSKPEEEIVLPLLPFEPKDITFNIFSSVLCEADDESW